MELFTYGQSTPGELNESADIAKQAIKILLKHLKNASAEIEALSLSEHQILSAELSAFTTCCFHTFGYVYNVLQDMGIPLTSLEQIVSLMVQKLKEAK